MFKANATVFIAVRCFQCSTMQVKQQKKSSNKWACAVCNEKQSVKKIYAQGYQAKNIRQFVQSFNMSRKFADEQDAIEDDESPSLGHSVEQLEGGQVTGERAVKRRVDWSEYVEDEGHGEPAYILKSLSKGADTNEPEIVTEFPNGGMFRKMKFKGKNDSSSSGQENNEVYKPQFSKRDAHKKSFKSQVEAATKVLVTPESRFSEAELVTKKFAATNNEKNVRRCWENDEKPKQHIATAKQGASKWNEYIGSDKHMKDDNDLPRNARRFSENGHQQNQQHRSTAKRGASKWSEYMEEYEDQCFLDENSALANDMNTICHYDLETNFAEQIVEDDIHPEFL